MFRIGEFSKIAQISIRMLRHYDEIDLFKPAHIDQFTGYRYYTAEQLPDLNKIIALKDLGLSLEQVTRLMHENLSQDELRGMLMLKKVQTEQAIRDELARLKAIESRIEQVENLGDLADIAIVLKSVPEQHYLCVRNVYPTMQDAITFIAEMQAALPSSVEKKVGHFMAISYDAFFDTENIDVAFGYLVDETFEYTVSIDDDHQMQVQILPANDTVLSATFIGDTMDAHRTSYNAMGRWLSNHHYHFIGEGREIMLQGRSETHDPVTEIQFPVAKLASQDHLLA